MVRETPLHVGHLRSMVAAAEIGAIIAPPVPALYARPSTLEDMIDQTLGRVLDLFDIEIGVVRRWRDEAAHVGLTDPGTPAAAFRGTPPRLP